MSNIIGIDLGTTMSALGCLNSIAKPEIIANSDGERIMPSVILFSSYESKAHIGADAKNAAANEPDRVVKEFKREMHNPDYKFNLDNKEYSAAELSSMILKKLTQDASKEIGEIKDVVISVPAYFKEKQRNATMMAGELAGLNVIGLINEPTAAALYYASTEDVKGTGLIYDLGGGTFDVTIVETNGNNINVLSSEGDHHLGGVDFDNAVLEIFVDKYKKEKNADLYTNEGEKQEFLLTAEEAKKKLSSQSTIKQKLRGDAGSVVIEITQEEFEEKISNYISRTELLTEQVFDEADIEISDIDYVLLVGGSTRLPIVSKSIKKLTGKDPITKVNVDEAVALGATIRAGLISLDKNPDSMSSNISRELNNIRVVDVANHSYGTIVISYDESLEKYVDRNTIIIKKNTPLPCSQTDTFYTTHEGQKEIDLSVTQGEDEDPDFVDMIHKDTMDLPPNRPEQQPIEFTYKYDENQIMHCTFKDINSGQSRDVQLSMSTKESSKSNVNSFIVE